MKFRNKTHEKRIIEVAKQTDSTRNIEEHAQNKYGEKWTHIDLNARSWFSKSTKSIINHTAGLNAHGERIKKINKNNDHAEFPSCTKEESR